MARVDVDVRSALMSVKSYRKSLTEKLYSVKSRMSGGARK